MGHTLIILFLTLATASFAQLKQQLWLTIEKKDNTVTILEQKMVSGSFKKSRRKAHALKSNRAYQSSKISNFFYRVFDEEGRLLDVIYLPAPAHDHATPDTEHSTESHSAETTTYSIRIDVESAPSRITFSQVEEASAPTGTGLAKRSTQASTEKELGSFTLEASQ
ncbi:MAG: hypothetical protein OCD01_08675 [Fibrobacterales bacterium]